MPESCKVEMRKAQPVGACIRDSEGYIVGITQKKCPEFKQILDDTVHEIVAGQLTTKVEVIAKVHELMRVPATAGA